MNYLKSLLSAGTKDSVMRIILIFVIVDIMISWNVACWTAQKFLDIPAGVAGILTAVVLGKAVQKFAEKDGKD